MEQLHLAPTTESLSGDQFRTLSNVIVGATLTLPVQVYGMFAQKRIAAADLVMWQHEIAYKVGQDILEWDKLFVEIKTLKNSATKRKEFSFHVPLDVFVSSEEIEKIIDDFIWDDDEWERIRRIKNYYKTISTRVEMVGFSPDQLRSIVQRGAVEFYYDLWVFTVVKFYQTRDQRFRENADNKPTEEKFKTEIAMFQGLEKYLSKDVLAKRSLYRLS